MDFLQILILAIVQGVAELLPVSSSAHVIVAEKLMGLDPTTPQMTLLLVMLHTGTMFAVIAYFWKSWRATYFSSTHAFRNNALYIVIATLVTGIVGLTMLVLIKHLFAGNDPNFEIEQLFGNARLMAASLAMVGILIMVSSYLSTSANRHHNKPLTARSAAWIGAVQGLCLPFRGFSRSGATISTGLILGVARRKAEEFSFALAVVLTPAVILKEAYRLYKSHVLSAAGQTHELMHLVTPSLFGMALSFVAGLVALRWLSRWLEQGRWHYFGVYCLLASLVVLRVG